MLHRCLRFATTIKSIPVFFQVACLIGLFWQLFAISSEYLIYKVNIQTTVFIPEQIEHFSMGICLPIEYSINYTKFNTEFQYHWTPNEFDKKDMFRNLSILEIYNYTYHAENILYLISYPENDGRRAWKSSNFLSIMNMKKYYSRSNICYLYAVRSFKPLSVDQTNGRNIISLFFRKEISKTYAVQLFIAEEHRYPFRETRKAGYVHRGHSSPKLDKFESSYYSIRKKILPLPYETACFDYSNLNLTNSVECAERCVVQKCFQKWGAIARASLLANEIKDYTFVWSRNFTKADAELYEIRRSCRSSCPSTSCEDSHIVTIQESAVHLGLDTIFENNVSLAWGSNTPSFSSTRISCRPTWTLVELILYMMSSVSTWTGLSMMSINPILFLRNLPRTKLAPVRSTVEHRKRHEMAAMNHTIRVSRLENRQASQSLAIERLRQMVFHLLNDRRSHVR